MVANVSAFGRCRHAVPASSLAQSASCSAQGLSELRPASAAPGTVHARAKIPSPPKATMSLGFRNNGRDLGLRVGTTSSSSCRSRLEPVRNHIGLFEDLDGRRSATDGAATGRGHMLTFTDASEHVDLLQNENAAA